MRTRVEGIRTQNLTIRPIDTLLTRRHMVLQDKGLTEYPRTRLLAFGVIAALVVITDQWTKSLVIESIPPDGGLSLIPGFVNLVHARNPGAAFGIMSEAGSGFRSSFLLLVSVSALSVILWAVFFSKRMDSFLLTGYSLFFGGAAGNLVDRIRFGEVIDFLDVHVGNYHWPAFNVADSALCVGVVFFLLHVFFGDGHQDSRQGSAR